MVAECIENGQRMIQKHPKLVSVDFMYNCQLRTVFSVVTIFRAKMLSVLIYLWQQKKGVARFLAL